MADGVELNAGSGGDTIAADEIGGKKHQRVKVQHGADGAASDVSTASPLPVDVRSDNAGGVEVVQDTAADLKVTATLPVDTFVAEDGALGKGVLLQGDDGADRHNVAVDASGRVQVDIAEQSDAADLKITLDSEDVTSGTADNFKADANVQVGDADASATNPLPTNAQLQSSYVYDGTTRCEIKRTNVVTNTDGADLVAAVAAKKFRVLAISFTATSATVTNVYLEDADGTDVFGSATGVLPLSVDADGNHIPGLVLPWNLGGWFQTPTVNKDLHIRLSAAQTVVVTLTYIEVS